MLSIVKTYFYRREENIKVYGPIVLKHRHATVGKVKVGFKKLCLSSPFGFAKQGIMHCNNANSEWPNEPPDNVHTFYSLRPDTGVFA